MAAGPLGSSGARTNRSPGDLVAAVFRARVHGVQFVPEIADVWPGTAWMATAAAVHIGRATGDRKLIAKALKMSEAVANRIYDDGATTLGHAFATPESWFVDNVNISRYAAYARARSVWQLVDALDTIPGSAK
jgi:non-lysosomal glucosylceramidase